MANALARLIQPNPVGGFIGGYTQADQINRAREANLRQNALMRLQQEQFQAGRADRAQDVDWRRERAGVEDERWQQEFGLRQAAHRRAGASAAAAADARERAAQLEAAKLAANWLSRMQASGATPEEIDAQGPAAYAEIARLTGARDGKWDGLAVEGPFLSAFMPESPAPKVMEIDGQVIAFDPRNPAGSVQEVYAAPPKPGWRDLSADEVAARGLDPEKKWQEGPRGELKAPGGSLVSVNLNEDTRPKPPPGFMHAPDSTVENPRFMPVPGGPAERVGSEVAGRIGLAEDAMRQLPDIADRAIEGDLTGIIDYAMGLIGRGQQGVDRREIEAASEAIVRVLTGAGMNESEARREARLYHPQPWDDAETVANKIEQLERRLGTILEVNQRGRGGVSYEPDARADTDVQPLTNPADLSDEELDAAIDAELRRVRE